MFGRKRPSATSAARAATSSPVVSSGTGLTNPMMRAFHAWL